MQCIKCGAELPDGSLYCNLCGKKQVQKKQARKGVKSRGNGQGSVYRQPNGKYRAAKTLGYEIIPGSDPPKKRRIVATRSDFVRRIDALNYLPILGTELDTRPTKHAKQPPAVEQDKTATTLKELYDLWQPTHKKSKSTMNCYASGFAVFRDAWDVPMQDQDIDDLQECMDSCEHGRRTLENAKTVLGLVYKYGIPRGYVPQNVSGQPNLASFLRIDADGSGHKQGLSAEELEKVRQAIGKVPYADYIYCHCYLGFRPSAFIALRVEDYNQTERAFVGGIKTEAGINRTVTVSPKIQPIVDRLIGGRSSGAVFCGPDGNALTIRKYRAIFYDVLAASGVQPLSDPPHRLTPHSCRHTFATLAKPIDAPLKDKLALIGHTSERQLMDYQDVRYEDLRKITDAL